MFGSPQLSKAILELLLKNSDEGIVLTNAENLIIFANPAFTQITGFSSEEILGKPGKFLRCVCYDEKFYEEIWQTIKNKGIWKGEILVRRKNNSVFLEWLTFIAIKNEKNEVINYLTIFSDITERKQSAERIKFLDTYDPLTKIFNRAKLFSILEQMLNQNNDDKNKIALLAFDIDQFKKINSSLGLTYGDMLLQQMASRLKEFLQEDEIFARISADEFMIVLPKILKPEMAAFKAQALLKLAQVPFKIDNQVVNCTACIGISVFPDDTKTATLLMEKAQTAMHLAKKKQYNSYQFFTQNMLDSAKKYLTVQNSLYDALVENKLKLLYQPLIDLGTQQMCSAEALIRHEATPPSEFIPVAEESDLIIAITDWVLKTVCQKLYEFQQQGLPVVPFAVNISSSYLQQENFEKKIIAVLQEAQLDPHLLKLEITETVLMENIEENIKIICRLKKMGVSFSIDDFGTGFSNFNYLRLLPIDQLKIDISFIRNITTKKADQLIVEAIINIAKQLKIKSIAEGAETQEQVEILQKMGCDVVQGYYFSKPLDSNKFAGALKENKTPFKKGLS